MGDSLSPDPNRFSSHLKQPTASRNGKNRKHCTVRKNDLMHINKHAYTFLNEVLCNVRVNADTDASIITGVKHLDELEVKYEAL